MKPVPYGISIIGRNAFKVGKEIAMNNGCDFHLAAWLKRGKSLIRIGVNQSETHSRFIRIVEGKEHAFLHAEMDALIAANPGDTLIVARWSKAGKLTMSRPCEICQGFIAEAKIKRVIYSGWDGDFYTESFK